MGRLVGRYASLSAFEARFFEDPTDFYLAGRVVGVLSSLATIVLTYHLAKRHFGRAVARAAALFMAVAYFQVRDAHYLKHDVPVGLLVVVALVAFDRVMERGSLRAYLASGAAMGVGFATHYYTIFLAPAFLVCHWVSSGLRRLGALALAATVSAVTFFLLSPFVLLNLSEAIDHMAANRQVVVDRSLEGGSILLPSLPAYAMFLLEQGLGFLLMGLVVVGCAVMARSDFRRFILWGMFPFLFMLLVGYTFFAGRYMNPILPSLAVAGGCAVGAIDRRYGHKVATVVALLACCQPLYYDLQVGRLFAGRDTRTLARDWILDNVPPGEAIAMQSYSVPLPQSSASLRESLVTNGALEELERRGRFSHLAALAERSELSYSLYFVGRGDEKNRIYFDYTDVVEGGLEPLRSRGVEKVVLRYAPSAPPAEVSAFFEEVKRRGRPVARFSPFRIEALELRPYMDNEDWPASRRLSHKGPLVEVWSISN